MAAPAAMELLLKHIDGEDELCERRLPIDFDTEIPIGRASKTEQKQLVPAVANGWIRNPVISRHHAVLTLEPSESEPAVVFIKDMKSSHGTYVNGENIQHTKRALQDGDTIRFGSEVMRGDETFRPPVFSFKTNHIGLTSSYRSPEITIIEEATTGKTISVPEDSDVESEGEEDLMTDEPSSEAPMSLFNPEGYLGSQSNPWTIDEPEMALDSELAQSTTQEQIDNASCDSNISTTYEDDLGIEETPDPEEEEKAKESHSEEAQYGCGTGYIDGPFAYNRPSWDSANTSTFASAPQSWELESVNQSSRVPTGFSPAEASVPQHSTIGGIQAPPTTITESITRVTSTRELIDENRRAYNKADMSIHNLINPSPNRESNKLGTKRKADELDVEQEEYWLLAEPKETAALLTNTITSPVSVEIGSNKLPQTPESLNKEPIATPIFDAVVPAKISTPVAVTAEPPRKKQKLRAMVTKAAIFGAGVVVGSAGMLGGLMSLPDGFFQS